MDTDLIILTTRLASFVIFVLALVADAKYLPYIRREEIQLMLGAIAVFIAVFFDLWVGLFCMAALFALYYRINREYIQRMGWYKKDVSSVVEVPSLSDELLRKAQDNTIPENSLEKEMIGFKGVYGEEVYGVQGLNATMPGYGATFENYSPVLVDA
jgi:hypothetical protein